MANTTQPTFAPDGRPLTDDLGRRPQVDEPDFVAFPSTPNRRPDGSVRADLPTYRMCFELVAGRWEGFVSTAVAR